MDWLNYHHLLYFYTVAIEGSIANAAKTLRLAAPTISGQLKQLEDNLGVQLFERQGRGLVLTETGQTVMRYATEIFGLGKELLHTVKGRPSGAPVQLRIGIVDVVPKLIAYRLIEAALQLPDPVRLVCHEDKADVLVEDLAAHRLDLVISDAPYHNPETTSVVQQVLGETTISVFGSPELAAEYRDGFPASLQSAPMLLPTHSAVLRGMLESWFESNDISPQVVAEFEDSALAKVFGQSGRGLFFAPSVIEKDITERYRVEVVGRIEQLHARFYAIKVNRIVDNPAVRAIMNAAKADLFLPPT